MDDPKGHHHDLPSVICERFLEKAGDFLTRNRPLTEEESAFDGDSVDVVYRSNTGMMLTASVQRGEHDRFVFGGETHATLRHLLSWLKDNRQMKDGTLLKELIRRKIYQRPPAAFQIDEATRPLGLGEEGIGGVRLGYVQMAKSKEVAAIKEHTSLVKAWNEFYCMYDSAGKRVCRTVAISTDARSPLIAVEAFLDQNTLNYDVLFAKDESQTLVRKLLGLSKTLVRMHSKQISIAHRDINPGNVMLQEGSYRFIDFGLSHRSATAEEMSDDVMAFREQLVRPLLHRDPVLRDQLLAELEQSQTAAQTVDTLSQFLNRHQ